MEREVLNFLLLFKFDYFFFWFIFVWLFWILYIFKKVIFWIWLWQLKEYRLDRMKAHFQLASSKKLFINKVYFLKIILLILFLISYFSKFQNLIIIFLFSALYFFLILASLIQGRGRLKKPVPTLKAQLLYALNLFFLIFLIPVLSLVKPAERPYSEYFIVLLFSDIFLPLIVSCFLALITPLSNFQKSRIILKAKKKIEKLQKNLLVIGISGSYGKTSTKEFLAEILSKKFRVCKTEANNNTEMGVAKTILEKLEESDRIFVVEMGAYKIGEIKKICDLVRPQIGILAGLGNQHLALFGSQENVIRAEYELIESLPEKGLAIFNGDSNFFLEVYKKTKKPKKFYSLGNTQANLYTKNLLIFKNRIEFKAVSKRGTETTFRINLLGKQNVSNILAALLVAEELGIKLEETKEVVSHLETLDHTMKLKRGVNGIVIIDDSYSGNYEGVISALNYLRLYEDNKKIIVFYPIIELGSMSQEVHRKIGKKIGEICHLAILVSQDFAREIKEGTQEAGMEERNIRIIQKPQEIVKTIKNFARKGDVVLLENRVPAEILDLLLEK